MTERMEGGLAEQEPGWWDWGSAYYQPEWNYFSILTTGEGVAVYPAGDAALGSCA